MENAHADHVEGNDGGNSDKNHNAGNEGGNAETAWTWMRTLTAKSPRAHARRKDSEKMASVREAVIVMDDRAM